MFKHFTKTVVIVAAMGLVAIQTKAANAQAVSFNVTLTTASPTFNRPIASVANNVPPTSLSTVGTNVYYFAQPFFVNTFGSYSLRNTSAIDDFLVIYQGSFVPTSPLTNALFANDDFSGSNAGATGIQLSSGVQYYYVATAFNNGFTGAITGNIGGDSIPQGATVTLGIVPAASAPEPGTLYLVCITGFVASVLPLRTKSKRRQPLSIYKES